MELYFHDPRSEGSFTGYRIKNVIRSHKTRYQEIVIADSYDAGRLLILNGILMLSQRYEFVYHEMITHIPMFSAEIKDVLIIGGGDGGSVRELLKHEGIRSIKLIEIDGDVVSLCREYFPELADSLDDSRVDVIIGDGFEFVSSSRDNSFDLIIIDSTDPIGPASRLISKDFYTNCKRLLRESGVMVCQSESPFFEFKKWFYEINNTLRDTFSIVMPYLAYIPDYPSGCWSLTFASDRVNPLRDFREEYYNSFDKSLFKYYNKGIHSACFSLPQFVLNNLFVS